VASETDSGSAIAASTQSYGYSASNQLASVTAGTGPGTTNNASYDPTNNPTTLAASSTTSATAGATQNYDNAGELCWQDTAVPSPLPTDPNARCATVSPTPTTGATVSTYSYNQSGDRTASTAATTSGTTTNNYAYTQADLLATFTPSTGSATTYTYNADGLRVSKTTAGTTTQFVYDTTQPTPQVLEDPANAYIYGPTGSAVEQVSSGGTPTYYVADQLGSTRALISSAATVVGTFTYGPTGTLMSSTGTLTSPLDFAGGYTDAETGFEYLVNRYYDPASDQFLSVDPLVSSTRAPYYYAGDNAVNNTDPSGEATLGECVSASVQSIGAFTTDGCLTRTVMTPSGNDDIGIVATAGGGVGPGAGVAVGGGFSISNANHLSDLANWFTYTTVTVDDGPGGAVSVFWNNDFTIYGISISALAGAEDGATAGKSWTRVIKFNDGNLANSARLVWDISEPSFAIQHELYRARLGIMKVRQSRCNYG
jgi:RHS repeat-associated protein